MGVVHFILNGEPVVCEAKGKRLLVDTLREDFGLTGTKKACGTGDCGACTVLIDGKPVRSCIYFTEMAEGCSILTIEGLGGREASHPLQKAFIEAGAIQCGFCTPGMILTAVAFLKENPEPTRDEIRKAIAGNLCRCTGYQKIIDAIEAAAAEMRKQK